MQWTDLGPLERSILTALAAAEASGMRSLTAEAIWRTLPGYETHLANVEAALAEGAPLRRWVVASHLRFGLADATAGPAPRGYEALRGLCKLPWLEAVAVGGTPALGRAGDGSTKLVVVAEGGRGPLAAWAIQQWLNAKPEWPVALTVLDADSLQLPAGDALDALAIATLRPLMNPDAFAALRDANPWVAAALPNRPEQGWADRMAAGFGDRFDGKLAALRRGLVSGDGGSLLRSAGRRGSKRNRIEAALQRRLATPSSALPTADRARFEARLAELRARMIEEAIVEAAADEPPPAAEPVETAPKVRVDAAPDAPVQAALEAVEPAPEATEPAVEAAGEPAEPTALPREPRVSTRVRGPNRRPLRARRSGAASETGQRARGSRRR